MPAGSLPVSTTANHPTMTTTVLTVPSTAEHHKVRYGQQPLHEGTPVGDRAQGVVDLKGGWVTHALILDDTSRQAKHHLQLLDHLSSRNLDCHDPAEQSG